MKHYDKSIMIDRREFITVIEFSKRTGTSLSTIKRYIRDGRLKADKIEELDNIKYLDWEKNKKLFYQNPPSTMQGRNREKPETKAKRLLREGSSQIIDISKKKPIVKGPKVEEIREESLESITGPSEGVEYPKINPEEYPECWVLDSEGNPVISALTGQKILDYDKLKKVLTAMSYDFDFKKKNGEYIPKSEFIAYIQTRQAALNSQLSTIPRRYGASAMAVAERLLNRRLSESEKAEFRDAFKSVPAEIVAALRSDTDKAFGIIENMTPEDLKSLAERIKNAS